MKKLAFIFLSQFIVALGFAQSNSVVGVTHHIVGSDTLRTFYLDDNYAAMIINKLSKELGAPKGENTGNMKWENVSIPGIGQNIDLVFTDGAMIYEASTNSTSFSVFTDPADMQAKLSHDPARFRRLMIDMKKGSNNKVLDAQAENAGIAWIEAKLFN